MSSAPPSPSTGDVRSLVVGAAATIVSPLPQFLTGAMAVQVSGDLRFGIGMLGIAIALNRAGQGVSSLYLGRLADRLGSTRALRLAMAISVVSSLGIALTARDFVSLSAWLIVASFAHALSQPASNRLLSRRVRPDRLGTAFGLKQAATPASTMLAGFAVPVFAVGFGWRWAYVATAAFGGVLILLLTRRMPAATARHVDVAPAPAVAAGTPGPAGADVRDRIPYSPFLLLTSVAFGLVLAGNVVVPSFYVASAVAAGTRAEVAGLLLGAGSVAAIVVRIVAGFAADHVVRRPLLLVASLVGLGGSGILLLSTGEPGPMSVGVILAVVGTWGFNGVFWFAIVRAYPAAPGSITGLLAPGGQAGATLGVLAFGFLVERFGYPVSWSVAAGAAFLSAIAMSAASVLLGRGPSGTGGAPTNPA